MAARLEQREDILQMAREKMEKDQLGRVIVCNTMQLEEILP
jgi:hypothetical protein